MTRAAHLAATALIVAIAAPTALLAPADAKPATKPRLSAIVKPVAESGKAAVLELRLSAKARKTVKVGWRTVDGTAKAGSDYTRKLGTVTIKKGKRAATVTIPILDDAAHEDTETFVVQLSSRRAKVPAKPVTVAISDNDAVQQAPLPAPTGPPTPTGPTAPKALTGTVTVTRTSTFPAGTTTLTMDLRLVPTATAGEWRDDGTGTWAINGSEIGASFSGCPPLMNTILGSGGFLTGAGVASEGKSALVLSGFDPATATGAPTLTWDGSTVVSTLDWFAMPPMPPGIPGSCIPSSYSTTRSFALAAPGATAGYTGATGASRGVTFGYGPVDPQALTVTGTLAAVS